MFVTQVTSQSLTHEIFESFPSTFLDVFLSLTELFSLSQNNIQLLEENTTSQANSLDIFSQVILKNIFIWYEKKSKNRVPFLRHYKKYCYNEILFFSAKTNQLFQ